MAEGGGSHCSEPQTGEGTRLWEEGPPPTGGGVSVQAEGAPWIRTGNCSPKPGGNKATDSRTQPRNWGLTGLQGAWETPL